MLRLAAVATLAVAVTCPAFAQKYDVKLNRDARVGEVVTVRVEGTQEMVQTSKKHPEHTRMQFLGFKGKFEQTTLKVANGKGVALKVKIVDLQLRAKKDGDWTPSSVIGKTLEIALDGRDTVFSGAELDEQTKTALRMQFTPKNDRNPDTQATFGPKGKVAIGESWDVDMSTFMKSLEKNMPQARWLKAGVEASMKLVKATKNQGQDCLRVEGSYKVPFLGRTDDDKGVFEGTIGMENSRDGRPWKRSMSMTVSVLSETKEDSTAQRFRRTMSETIESIK